MSELIMLIAVVLPILAGISVWILPFKSRRAMLVYLETGVILTSLLVLWLLLHQPQNAITVFRFTGNLSVTFRMDGLGAFYAALVAFLWPLAMLYSFEYMKHEHGNEKSFFMFYVITYGITLGVALAENILTMYFFFEMLSLVTVPLVMHTRTREAVKASRIYLYNMLGGAAFAFIGMIFILTYGTSSSFVAGGVLDLEKIGGRSNLMLVIYVLCFCGFSVKTAIWPFSGWLPKAGVAPTPVTALLHAVAVVNTGAFAAMRVTYYSFGTDAVKGTWAQAVVMILVIITIVYGCSRALKETHLKRRLAWSTVSNLSYMLFGVVLMLVASHITPAFMRSISLPFLIFTWVLLAMVLLVGVGGDEVGATRWLDLGFVQFQPSELVKIAEILIFATMICTYKDKMRTFKYGVLPFGIVIGVTVLLLYLEPHLSASVIVIALGAIMMWAGGTRWQYFAVGGGLVGAVGYFVVTKMAYASARITAWLDPWSDPLDSGLQTIQSLYAIGSGGLLGLGLGQGRQKYMYLPEEHNDFIFSIVCEELGFVGAMLILVLFALLIIRGYWLAVHARDRFGALVITGITSLLAIQVILNVAVVTNLVPCTGISLPFFSYGGTALLLQLAEMGIVLSISREIPLRKSKSDDGREK